MVPQQPVHVSHTRGSARADPKRPIDLLVNKLPPAAPVSDAEARLYTGLIRSVADHDADLRDRITADPGFDADRFIRFALDHRVCTLLCSVMSCSFLDLSLRDDLAQVVETLGWDQQRRDVMIAETLGELIPVLTDGTCDPTILKGCALSGGYYRPDLRRSQQDLDVLVPADRRTHAIQLLVQRGFRPELPITRHRLANRNAIGFVRADHRVDLHWGFSADIPNNIDYERVLGSRCGVVLHEQRCSVLDDEHTLLFLALNLAHDIGRGAAKLQQLVDVHVTLTAAHDRVDWDSVMMNRAGDGTLAVFVNTIDLVLDVFGTGEMFGSLGEAMRRSGARIVPRTPLETMRLIRFEPNRVGNRLWLFDIQSSRIGFIGRAARRTLSGPGRVPLLVSRSIRWPLLYLKHRGGR